MQEFIVAIREHANIGHIPTAYQIELQEGDEFYVIQNSITAKQLSEYAAKFSEAEIQLVKIIDEISDVNLMRKFASNKKKIKNPKQFFQSLDKESFENQIRPYVERRVVRVLDILKNSEVRLFHKTDNLANIYFTDEVSIEEEPAETVFNIHRGREFTKYYLSIFHENEDISLHGKKGIIISNEPCRLMLENQLFYFDDIDGKKLQPFFVKKFIPIQQRAEKKWFELFAQPALKRYRVNSSGFEIKDLNPEKKAKLTLQTNMSGVMSFIFQFYYGNRSFYPNYKDKVLIYFVEKKTGFYFERFSHELDWEQACFDKLARFGLQKDKMGFYSIKHTTTSVEDQNYEMISWLNENKEKLIKVGFEVETQETFEEFYFGKYKLDLGMKKGDKDWFDVYAIVKFDEFEIPFIKFRKHILKNEREYELPNGKTFVLPDIWFSQFKNMMIFSKDKDGLMQFETKHFNLLDEELIGIDNKYFQGLKELTEINLPANIEIPKEVNAKLRTYQKEGYYWMKLLQENKFGGCLADDMGLGKTLQTLSLLSASYSNGNNAYAEEEKTSAKAKTPAKANKNGQLSLFNFDEPAEEAKEEVISNTRPASLIVMPVSLIMNWENEILKFNPNLKIMKYTGSNRTDNLKDFDNYHIVLSSYGIVRNDHDFLRKYKFHYIILDESQNIKNSKSKAYKALLQLESSHKLVLTGTPIENSLTDLWSQMNFVNDGLLGNLNFFNEEFVVPIERYKDETKEEKLQELIKPFILRRTKEKVAKDLPPVTEQLQFCDMSPKQKEFYEEEKSKIRNQILENIGDKGESRISFLAIQGLTRLRQIANHSVLADAERNYESGKFEIVSDKLETLMSEGHKVLIFSSFVKHLGLFEQYFAERQWTYSILTGEMSKTQRQKAIDDFQNNKDNKLFLISIKAGGTGLNLTSADYVFILDPWWNPAVELQAINRAHRIGQDKNVFVYRFISNNTVEKKIRKLQEEKSALAETFINSNNPFKDFNKEKLMDFFD